MSLHLRRARPSDGPAVGRVHVASWRAAYRGLVSDALLASLDPVKRGVKWRARIAAGGRVWVAEDGAGEIAGFADTDPRRTEGALATIGCFYLHPDHWRRGVGRALLDRVLADLRAEGFTEAHLWVLEGNAGARRFYERHGFAADGERMMWRPETENLPEVRYRKAL